MNEVTCQCDKCRRMCEKSCCVPTPEEARELIRRGYGPRLALYGKFVAPKPKGTTGPILPPTNFGACEFYQEGLCELHPLGLKSLEGRLAHHDRGWEQVRKEVLKHWRGQRYESVRKMLDKTVGARHTARVST